MTQNEWQPIETAPNDWTLFLARCPSTGLVEMRQCDGKSETWSLTGNTKHPEPTHWQPLPPESKP